LKERTNKTNGPSRLLSIPEGKFKMLPQLTRKQGHIESAQAAKDFFDKHKLQAFVKTSGKTGIHLYLP